MSLARPFRWSFPAAALLTLVVAGAAWALPCANSQLFDVQYATADTGATQVLAAKLDGDGRDDLVIVSGGLRTIETRLHGAGATFTTASSWTWTTLIRRAVLADLDRDGMTDLAFTDDSSRVVIYRGAGDGTMTFEKTIPIGTPVFDIVAGDFGNGGALELVVSQTTVGKITTLMSTAGWNYTLVTTSVSTVAPDPRYLAIGKINSDALLDIVVSRQNIGQVRILRGRGTGSVGDGSFTSTTSAPTGSQVASLRVADLDRDGILDIVAGTTSAVAWSFGVADGTYSPAQTVAMPGASVYDIVVADLNRDSIPDILAARKNSNLVTAIKGRGGRVLEVVANLTIGDAPLSLVELDLGGSGDHDFVVATRNSASLSLLASHCDPLVESPPPPPDIRPVGAPIPFPDPTPEVAVAPPPPFPDPGPAPAVAPWPTGGLVLCNAPGEQSQLTGTDDFAHGAYFAWIDQRSGATDVYALRVGPDGQPVNGWTTNGTAISVGNGVQSAVVCVTDGPWGVWLAWISNRDGTASIYLQKVTLGGQLADGWPAGGRKVCTAATPRAVQAFAAFPDRYGGLQLAWTDLPSPLRVAAVSLGSDGMPRASWPACGVNGATFYSGQGICHGDYLSLDSWAPYWPNGVLISTSYQAVYQRYPELGCSSPYVVTSTSAAALTSGGWTGLGYYSNLQHAIVNDDEVGGWYSRAGGNMNRVGSGHPSWTLAVGGGLMVPGAPGQFHNLVYDSGWERYLVRRIEDDGSWSPGFGAAGQLLCDAPCRAYGALAQVADGSGGVFVVWGDIRQHISSPVQSDLYATWYRSDGTRGPGWRTDGDPIVLTNTNEELATIVGNRRGAAIVGWRDQRNGNWDLYAYRLTNQPVATSKNRAFVTPEFSVHAPRAAVLAFAGARPNPSPSGLIVEFSLSRAGDATLRALDVAGREVARQDFRAASAGPYAVDLGAARSLAPGIYLLELSAEGRRLHSKVVVTR